MELITGRPTRQRKRLNVTGVSKATLARVASICFLSLSPLLRCFLRVFSLTQYLCVTVMVSVRGEEEQPSSSTSRRRARDASLQTSSSKSHRKRSRRSHNPEADDEDDEDDEQEEEEEEDKDDEDGEDDEKDEEDEKKVVEREENEGKQEKKQVWRGSSKEKKASSYEQRQLAKELEQRDGVGRSVAEQATQAWELAHSDEWRHLFEVLTPVTTQAEFDRLVQKALNDGHGALRLLLIVSRLVRTDTEEVERLRRALLAAAHDKRHPKSQLDRTSEPIEAGGINDVQDMAGFVTSPNVVYFRCDPPPPPPPSHSPSPSVCGR